MATWTIKGEEGKGLDDVVRSVQSLGIDSARLEFAALAEDVFTFSMRTTTAAGAGLDGVNRIPTAGQKIEVFRNGVRKFTGHAMLPEVDLDRVTVRVVGPWFWMSTIPISSAASGAVDSGTDADGTRPVYAFPTQGLRESLRLLNNAARTAGVPVQNITSEEVANHISGMFTCLKTTLSGRSWADALTEMLNWCVDAVAWYDYGTATPKLMVTRRGSMSPLTLTVGSNVTQCRIRPRLDLEVKRVELHYVTRHPTTGAPRWARLSHGTAEAGKVQMIPVSGPDVADLVPMDDADSVSLQTVDWSAATADFVIANDAALSAIKSEYGVVPGTIANTLSYYQGQGDKRVRVSLGYPGRKIRAVNGAKLKKAQKWLLISGATLPDWAIKQFKAVEVELTGTWIAWTANGTFTKSFQALRVGATAIDAKFRYESTSSTEKLWFTVRPWTVRGWVINVSRPSKTTEYKPWEWDFLSPPSGLAENLRDCQNWVPWEGPIETIEDDVSGDNVLNRKIRLANSAPVCATMDALLKRVSYDILNNRTTYTLGAPARLDYGTFISRIRRQKIDNIVWL